MSIASNLASTAQEALCSFALPSMRGVYAGSLVELEESSCTGGSGAAVGGEEGGGALSTLEEHLLTGHSGAVVCLAMYQDHLLFSGSTDCTIKVCTFQSLTALLSFSKVLIVRCVNACFT